MMKLAKHGPEGLYQKEPLLFWQQTCYTRHRPVRLAPGIHGCSRRCYPARGSLLSNLRALQMCRTSLRKIYPFVTLLGKAACNVFLENGAPPAESAAATGPLCQTPALPLYQRAGADRPAGNCRADSDSNDAVAAGRQRPCDLAGGESGDAEPASE